MDLPEVTHRKRLKRFDHLNTARFLTFSCRRLPLFRNDRIKQVFVDRLAAIHDFQFASGRGWIPACAGMTKGQSYDA